MTPQSKGLTETQIGAITEDSVVTQLILHSERRWSPYKPVADDSGIDLLVQKKHTNKVALLQIKSLTKSLKRNRNIVHFDVRNPAFYGGQKAYLLVIFLELEKISIERAWLMPMDKLESIAMKRAKKLLIRPSIKVNSEDRYHNFRCNGMAEVVSKLEGVLGHD